MDNIELRKHIPDRLHVGGGHVHGHGPELDLLPAQTFQERGQRLCALTMSGMEDLSGFQVHDHGHVPVPLSHRELVHGNVTDSCELSLFQPPSQIFLENAFHQIPSNPEKSGHSLDGGDATQLHDKAIEGFQAPALGFGKMNGLPEHPLTAPTGLFMSMKDNLLRPSSDRQCVECPGEPPGLSQVVPAGSASPAGAFRVFQSHMVEHRPLKELGAPVLVVSQAHSVVKVACRRHDRSPLVSVVGKLRTRYRVGGDFSITTTKSLPYAPYSESMCTPAFAG